MYSLAKRSLTLVGSAVAYGTIGVTQHTLCKPINMCEKVRAQLLEAKVESLWECPEEDLHCHRGEPYLEELAKDCKTADIINGLVMFAVVAVHFTTLKYCV